MDLDRQPSLINEARATFSLDDVYIPVNTALAGFSRGQFGINYPYLFLGQGSSEQDSNRERAQLLRPGRRSVPLALLGTDLDRRRHAHQGLGQSHLQGRDFTLEYSGENDGDQINVRTVPGGASNQNGNFTFTDARTGLGATTGVGLANLAIGLADSYTEIGPRALTIWRGAIFEEFAQDSWKVSSKLHLDYGYSRDHHAGLPCAVGQLGLL